MTQERTANISIKQLTAFCLLLALFQLSVASATLAEERIKFTVPAAPWMLTLPKGNLVVEQQVSHEGRRGYFSMYDEKNKISLSFFIEPVKDCKDSKACRDMVWKLGNSSWENPQKVIQSEIGGVSCFEFFMPSFQGQPVKQQNMYAEFVKDGFIDGCASEIVMGTPLAYLPEALSRQLGWPLTAVSPLSAFTPEDISRRLGGGLNKAMIFAARAHATFDVPRIDAVTTTTAVFSSSRLTRIVLPEVLATSRSFDNEFPTSTALLNEASEVIAAALEETMPTIGTLSPEPLVREVDSRGIDALQASDVAAGWAREMLETGDTRVLDTCFERVWINGRRL